MLPSTWSDLVTAQRRNSAFFATKKAVVFFLENGRYKPNEQISKEKKGQGEKTRFFAHFSDFFCFQKWRFYEYWYILFHNS